MITEHDLQEAIAECKGVIHPDAKTCIKLAAFLIIQKEMFGNEPISYSYDSGKGEDVVEYYGESEFAELINGRIAADMWAIMDELMTALQVVQPRLYNAVIRKLAP